MIGRLLCVAGIGLQACGTAAAPAPPPPPPPTVSLSPRADAGSPADAGATASRDGGREERLVADMLRRVEAARGLASTRPVPGVVLDRAALIARVKAHLATELPPEAIRDEGLALQLFGFVPTSFAYEAAEYDLLQDQLAGYYEPADRTMYLAGDLAEPEAEATLAHELVHALQDQRWDLAARCKYHPGDGDHAEAVSALAEGDATSAMFDVLATVNPAGPWTALDIPDDVFAAQIRAGMERGPGADAPRIMRSSLAAPYMYGTLFVHALRRRGGWAEVNRAWDEPPMTTEQILHVDKWVTHEPPLAVPRPSYGILGEGWTVADDDSEGELGARLAFEEWTDARAAADLAAGWGGDRALLLVKDDLVAYAWRLRYDAAPGRPSARAEATLQALERALQASLGPMTSVDATFACRARADRGPFAVARVGEDLVFALGPARVRDGAWSSAGDCAMAKRWVRSMGDGGARPRSTAPSR